MAILVALDEMEHQVPDVEGPTLHSMAVVLWQNLLNYRAHMHLSLSNNL